MVKQAAVPDWRRRTLRAPGDRPLRRLARTTRILALLLSTTGCAVETPRPTAMSPPEGTPGSLALLPPPILSRFGEWRGEGGTAGPARHAGIDIRAKAGTSVLAAADGRVLRTGWQAFAGRLIAIGHDDDVVTVYYHLSTITVVAGQAVRRGDVIGRVGMSGNATAPHLHFGLCRREGGLCGEWIDGGWADPTQHWIAANPCFLPGRTYARKDTRLTYPVACMSASTVRHPVERPPGAALSVRSSRRPA
jgi:murein DD-endopeptidase MepM/ murein hydrolase activator NlpD